jgi:uncharacterized protein
MYRWSLSRTAAFSAAARRFRMNVLVDTGDDVGLVEDGWIGRRVAIGDSVVLAIERGMTRCLMVDLPQAEVDERADLLRPITELNEGRLGVVARVLRAGTMREGDPVRLV